MITQQYRHEDAEKARKYFEVFQELTPDTQEYVRDLCFQYVEATPRAGAKVVGRDSTERSTERDIAIAMNPFCLVNDLRRMSEREIKGLALLVTKTGQA